MLTLIKKIEKTLESFGEVTYSDQVIGLHKTIMCLLHYN